MNSFRITGRVIDRETGHGVPGLRVETWDKDLICNDLVGSAVSDEQGAFQIVFDQSYFQELFQDRRPDLFFRVFRDDQLIKSTEDSVLWNISTENLEITIEIEETETMNNHIQFTVGVNFEEVTSEKQPPSTSVYAFDSKGKFLASAPVDNNQAILSLPANTKGQVVRFMVGPSTEKSESPKMAQLKRLQAYEKRLRVNPERTRLDLTILNPIWIRWLFCSCVVRGRLIKRITLPDGTVRELPICNARVTICEVDPIYLIIWRLPDDLVLRLREELLDLIRNRIPIPPIPPEPEIEPFFAGPQPIPGVGVSSEIQIPFAQASSPQIGQESSIATDVQAVQIADVATQSRIQAITSIGSLSQLRQGLVQLADIIRLYICWWPWLYPFYRVDCLGTVEVDEEGRFETSIFYWCFGDKPDLYFKAEQLQGGIWQTIYNPPIPCNVYWNYACGSEVVLNVTDPSAVACVPEDPVEPPSGVTTWVMPLAVGNTKIWGTPLGTDPTPKGWVRSDGKTNYKDTIRPFYDFVDAPFGGYLGFRQNYSNDINGDDAGSTKSNNIRYYRWSYRKGGSGAWKQMEIPVFRHYVKQRPGELPSFPVYQLGPCTEGSNSNLFKFKPSVPDPDDSQSSWPIDNGFGDIYSSFLNTLALSPNVKDAAGQYQIKLEVFDTDGNQVIPGPETFQFIVPSGVDSDRTILSRQAEGSELDDGGFVFNLHIDNNPCTATIDKPKIGTTAVTDNCGFLRYNPDSSTPVTIAFGAKHENDFAKFTFNIKRGSTFLVATDATNQEVDASTAGPYTGSSSNFTTDFPLETLLCGTNDSETPVDLSQCCVNAAFAESLNVYAKATTGRSQRITAYDAYALRAFALAPQEAKSVAIAEVPLIESAVSLS